MGGNRTRDEGVVAMTDTSEKLQLLHAELSVDLVGCMQLCRCKCVCGHRCGMCRVREKNQRLVIEPG